MTDTVFTRTDAVIAAGLAAATETISILGALSSSDYTGSIVKGNIKSVVIGTAVTSIGVNAFQSCTALTTVTFNETSKVETIGNQAFLSCSKLQSLTIPDSVTSIGSQAFYECSALQSLTIGNSVTSIGPNAFRECSALTTVTIPDSVTIIGNYAFRLCTELQLLTIGNSVETIGGRAFLQCSKLQSVTIGTSVETIGNYAFSSCSELQSLTIPDSVTSIGDRAFQSCSKLTTVTIGNGVTSIGIDAFLDSGLTTIYVTSNNGLGLSAGLQSEPIGGKDGITVVFSDAAEEEEKSKLISNTPIIRTLNNSITYAKYGSPMKDLTSDNTMFFAMNRYRYIRTKYTSNVDQNEIKQQKKWYGNNDNSRLARESNYQRRLDFPNNEFNIQGRAMSNTNNYEKNYVERSIKRTRAGGARVPLKVTQKNIS